MLAMRVPVRQVELTAAGIHIRRGRESLSPERELLILMGGAGNESVGGTGAVSFGMDGMFRRQLCLGTVPSSPCQRSGRRQYSGNLLPALLGDGEGRAGKQRDFLYPVAGRVGTAGAGNNEKWFVLSDLCFSDAGIGSAACRGIKRWQSPFLLSLR